MKFRLSGLFSLILAMGCAYLPQAHALDRVQDAALDRLLAVADIGQCTPLDHAERVLEVGALGVGRQAVGVARGGLEVEDFFGHGVAIVAPRSRALRRGGCHTGFSRNRKPRTGQSMSIFVLKCTVIVRNKNKPPKYPRSNREKIHAIPLDYI